MWSTKTHVHSNRTCVCWYVCLLETGSSVDRHMTQIAWVKTLDGGRTQAGWVIVKLRQFGDVSLCEFSRCCVRRLKLQELKILTEKKQWHQAGWPQRLGNDIITMLTAITFQLYSCHSYEILLFFFFYWEGWCVCTGVYKTYSR